MTTATQYPQSLSAQAIHRAVPADTSIQGWLKGWADNGYQIGSTAAFLHGERRDHMAIKDEQAGFAMGYAMLILIWKGGEHHNFYISAIPRQECFALAQELGIDYTL